MQEEFVFYFDKTKNKPKYRGTIHKSLFYTTPVWSMLLLLHCNSITAIISTWLYAFACYFCYGCSFTYHKSIFQNKQDEIFWSRMDTFGIFVFMTFNSTPVLFLLIPDVGFFATCIMVVLCFCGFIVTMNSYPGKPYFLQENLKINRFVFTAIYMIFALLISFMILPSFVDKSNRFQKLCWCTGSIFYFAGGLIYAFCYPDPFPNVFGYHEVFHLFTAISAILTFACNLSVITST